MNRVALAFVLLFVCVSALAQPFTENFEKYSANSDPLGWLDASARFATADDPLAPGNAVYAAQHRARRQRAVNRRTPGELPEGGAFATLGGRIFSAGTGFEYRGRFLRATPESLAGITFFSTQPEGSEFHMLALWRGKMGLHRNDRTLAESEFVPDANRWYRFAIRCERESDGVRIRARVWVDGASEPDTWMLDALDRNTSRVAGRIGLWSLAGAAYFDDLTVTAEAEEEVDKTAPAIVFSESGETIAGTEAFNRTVRIDVAAIDASGVQSMAVLLDDQPFKPGDAIAGEGRHELFARAVDTKGNAGEARLTVIVDKSPPVIAIAPLPPVTNQGVTPRADVTDLTQTTVAWTLNGTPFVAGTTIEAEGTHTLGVTAEDAVGWKSSATAGPFVIDRTPPSIAITSPAEGAQLGSRQLVVTGTSSGAVRVVVNDVDATLANGAFSAAVVLAEGENEVVVVAYDAAGNETQPRKLRVIVDTRVPFVTIAAPAANACVGGTEVTLQGTAQHATAVTLRVNDAAPVSAIVTGSEWTAVVPVPEGRVVITADASGATATIALNVDRTKPVVTATEDGIPFTQTLLRRDVVPFVRAGDGDTLAITLNGVPYVTGTPVTAEQTHVLRATATDCAGNAGTFEHTFTIDRTPPSIVTIAPANGASVGSRPPLTGTLSEPATLVVDGTDVAATIDGLSFSLAAPLEEGTNELALAATDRAGNVSRTSYALRVKTSGPVVEIVENGLPIPRDAVFNRAVAPVIRVSDAAATLSATLNGQPFSAGGSVSSDGAYTLSAKATDAFGRDSDSAVATFTIDRTPPQLAITAPANGATLVAAEVEVRGTVDADAQSVTINGVAAAISGTAFVATVRLEDGPNVLAATATDRAGNARRVHVEIVRNAGRLAIFLTAPPPDTLTNRPATIVAGQVINLPPSGSVRINNIDVAIDAAGAFRKLDFPLVEGRNEITASVTGATGQTNSVTVAVIADFTPPLLDVTANAIALNDGARFAVAPRIAVNATDAAAVTTTLTIDGAVVTGELPLLADGGHALTAVARDAAGNETRVDRTFFVGESASLAGCVLTGFDPKDGAAVLGESVRIHGHSGGAAAVLIDGQPASVVDGTFCGEATLVPGRNEVTIRCADANGRPTDDAPVTLVLWRDVEPSIAIASAVRSGATVTIGGTVSEGVVSGDVNGLPFEVANRAFTVPDVALSPGLNVITARAMTGSGRTALATTRVELAGTPQLAITSPIAGTETGASTIDVTGTYVHVDPATIQVNGIAATTTRITDTSGTFAVNVPLPPGVETTLIASAGAATARVTVQHVLGAPSIAIAAPLDNAMLPSTFAGPLEVSGTFTASDGAQVQINGIAATLASNLFTASIPLPSSAAPIAILARVIEPDGEDATDTIRVTRLASPLQVRDTFPAMNATNVDRGAALIVLFTSVVESADMRLTDANGASVAGRVYVDRDAVTFAPDAPLRAGETYTLTSAHVTPAHALRFTTAATAPSAPPLVDDVVTEGCLTTVTITGRASVPGARVRLEADGVTLNATANDTGAFRFVFPFSGRPGFHLARIRQLGEDGSRSADRAICFRVNCELPRVAGAALDRGARTLTIDFSRAMDPSSLAGNILVVPDGGTALDTSVTLNGAQAIVTIASEIPPVRIALRVKKEVRDASGASMAADYTQTFHPDATGSGRGEGYVTGAVYDATTGRPLANAIVTIGDATLATNDRGRYSRALPEGAWTIEARAEGYTSAWRQVVVPAGAGVVPIDIRLTRRGALNVFTHGGDTSVTKPVTLTLASASLPPGRNVRVTAVGAQSLAGLLPLGWAPLAAVEVVVDDAFDVPLSGATLAFRIDAAAVRAANQTLSIARYDRERDEWLVVVAVATVADDVTFEVPQSGAYALVYPDAAPHLAHPAPARNGIALQGVVNPCGDCALTGRSFTLEPRAILPSGRAVATLVTEGATQPYPSGTAVQATIDEQLNLADGRVIVDPPFATDLLVYRTLAGDTAVAELHLAPTPQAAAVMLRDGVERVRIVDYPGRVDRGTLIGAEGGRVPGDGGTLIEIPAGATFEPLHASATTMTDADLAAFGTIAGFRIAGGFMLALTRANPPPAADNDPLPPSLVIPARATFAVPNATASSQVVVVEVLPQTSYGIAYELIAIADPSGPRFTTRAIDSTQLPLDGIVRDGRYLVLVAESPVAYAFGTVRTSATGLALGNARVSSGLGVTSITSPGGLFVLPVPSQPAAPFSLVARSLSIGDGAAATAPGAPDAGAYVDFGVLALAAQSPRLTSIAPDGGELDVAAAFVVRATFDTAIDPASASDGIRVVDVTANRTMRGSVTVAGNVVMFHPGEPLAPASQYTITLFGTLRGTNGAPFGQTVVRSFTTTARPAGSTAFHPDRIRVTIPDANGRSRIRGTAGALPAGSQALAVRRGRFFVETYQATVAVDGSFSFDAGHLHARDRISIDDLIDLQVIDPVSRAVTAILELTPFVSDDDRGFVARHDRDTRFVSDQGIAVIVPRGAFDVPTFIGVHAAGKNALDGVPRLDQELMFATAVELKFEGVAKLPLDLELPASVDASREWLLGSLGASTRGPRLMIVDLLHVSGATLRTGPAPSGGAHRTATNAAITGPELRSHFLRVERSGVHAAVSLNVAGASLAWGLLDGVQQGYDLYWDTIESLYAAYFYIAERRGSIVIPVIKDQQFTITGVDAGTGLDAFTKMYDPIAESGAVPLANPNPDRTGPYPVFATPFRIETLDVNVENVPLTSIRDFTVTLDHGVITATSNGSGRALVNVTRGTADTMHSDGLSVDGAPGDRVVLLAHEANVDPHATFSIVFDEPVDPNGLASLIALETAPDAATPFAKITGALRISTDSGGRRVLLEAPSSLTRGNRYRLVLSPEIRNASGLRIAQVVDANGNVTGGLHEPLYLELTVRKPGDRVTSFDIAEGEIRDQALLGNVLFVAAGSGGLIAYDVANPAVMTATPSRNPHLGTASGAADYWALATDHHNRIYATGITGLVGVLHAYRLEQFLPTSASPGPQEPRPIAGATVSYVPGAASGLEITSRLLGGDRVEAYPRRVQIVVQDSEIAVTDRDFAAAGAENVAANGDLFALEFDRDAAHKYAIQRITIVNDTLGLRWSADATVTAPAKFDGVYAREGDTVRVLINRTAYAVISLFGYGVGIYDVNGIESNDAPEKPANYKRPREQIRITSATARSSCPDVEPHAIPDLTFSPDAVLVSRPAVYKPDPDDPEKQIEVVGATDLFVYALDSARGVLDLWIKTPDEEEETKLAADALPRCEERAPIGLVFRNLHFDGAAVKLHEHPRLAKLRERFEALEGRAPSARFTGASPFTWSLDRTRNATGERGSLPGTDVRRQYMLVAGNEYGLLVVEIDGTPPANAPAYVPLQPFHLVDVIWIPDGAYAVRAVPGTSLASVVDGRGHVLLVDLARVDERWGIGDGELFPTVASMLQPYASGETPPPTGTGRPDPRIVWQSKEPLAIASRVVDENGNVTITVGTLAPVADPDTGFVYAGTRLAKTTTVVSALDPRMTITDATGETELGGIVPFGIAPPPALADRTLGAFRVQLHMPGGIDEALNDGALTLAIDSERVPGAKTEDTPQGWPHAHLSGVAMRRAIPDAVAHARYQRAWNKWRSDPIVALADPRAARSYGEPPSDCVACTRAPSLHDAKEIFSLGRAFRIRVAPLLFTDAANGFAYLDTDARLETRVSTIPADTVRAPNVRVAAQMPPVAGGALQETTYLHSGELETTALDYDAGGRAGWNVTLDRTYRSRTIGLSAIGAGWEASIFRRLRELPNGDVEYRDGVGELWLFARRNGRYVEPEGLYLRLTADEGGWALVDQEWRVSRFDRMGRLVSESDEWVAPAKAGSGNTIRYVYDAKGRLAAIVDPVGRRTTLTWDDATGLLQEVRDWRTPARTIAYRYDAQRRLTDVLLPEVVNTSGERPKAAYRYATASAAFRDLLETATNLEAIVDPREALTSGVARVTFAYDADRVRRQTWGTGESATFAYPDATHAVVTDALGQERRYTLTTEARPHVAELQEPDVEVWAGAPFGKLPEGLAIAAGPGVTAKTRTFRFAYEHGALQSSELDGVATTTNAFTAPAGAPGVVLGSTTTQPAASELGAPITRGLLYQSVANGSTFLRGVTAGGKQIEVAQAHRNNAAPSSTNDAIVATSRFDASGQFVESASSGGTDAAGAGASANVEYVAMTGALHARALPRLVRNGDVETTFEYPSETETRTIDARGVVTTAHVDAWGRRVHVVVERPGDALVLEQRFFYDATGRLERMSEKKGAGEVVTSYAYDVMGRRTSATTNQIATVGSVTVSTAFDLAARTITTTHSSGAITTATLDSLGRVTKTETLTNSSPIEQRFAYDLAGNRVYASDLQTATAFAFDAHGRLTKTLHANGAISSTDYDEWHRPTLAQSLAEDRAEVVGETSYAFTDAGRMQSVATKVDAATLRTTELAWDGGGRTTAVATNGRASKSKFDAAGRFVEQAMGAGDVAALSEVFERAQITAHKGMLPVAATSIEKAGAYAATMDRNTAGDVVRENVGALEWTRAFDELGNVTRASEPARPESKFDVDARGAVTAETLPDGALNQYAFDAAGALSAYTDPVSEATSTQTDFIGRPVTRTYADDTTESFEWDGPRLKSITDRQGRKQTFEYNAKGQLEEVRGAAGVIDRLAYDGAGRLVSWKNADSELAWSDFDLDGNPRKTTQRRFKGGTGLGTPVVLDEYVQEHRWNEHGERTRFSMPAAPGVTLAERWTKWLRQSYDAMGNLTSIARLESESAADALPLMTATYRAAGRPDVRTLSTAGGSSLVRTYAYDAASSLLSRVEVTANGVVVAGSAVTHDGLQVAQSQLLGISSGERVSRWRYDARGRVTTSAYGVIGSADALAREQLDPADFREQQERTSRFDAHTSSVLHAKGVDVTPLDPPTATFAEEPGGGHKVASAARGEVVRPFAWHGAERVSDGRFTYTFDAKGRLLTATETGRRLVYTYSGTGRLIGRRVESGTTVTEEQTFVWDPIADRLVAVYDTATGALVKQIIHGDAAYDDPLETTTATAYLYPVFDEGATGVLQAILDADANVVARNLPDEPYGAGDLALTGPAVDRIAIDVAADSVSVTLHTTEPLAPSTVPTGARLTADARVSPVAPALADAHTIRWTFTREEWTTFTTAATTLSVAATSTLRATTWSPTTPILPPPTWALATLDTHTTPTVPFELRAAVPTTPTSTTLYEAQHLSLIATRDGDTLFEDVMAARFQALPFAEPATGLVYARARWYDPGTGTFLSPDPMGYADSSNLYAFASGDPVNKRDPLGTEAALTAKGHVYITNFKTGERFLVTAKKAHEHPVLLQDMLMIEGGLSAQEAKDFLQDMGLKYTHPYQRQVVRPKLPKTGNWVEAAFIATTGLPPQTREQELLSGGFQIASTVVGVFGSPYAYKGTVSVRPEKGVAPYEVDTYGNLRSRSATNDGLDLDHQPSHASNLARREAELGRPLTPAEIKEVMIQGTAVAVPEGWHRSNSPTYGGRNKPAVIEADKLDPSAAAARDSAAMVVGAAPRHRADAEAAATKIRKRAGGQ